MLRYSLRPLRFCSEQLEEKQRHSGFMVISVMGKTWDTPESSPTLGRTLLSELHSTITILTLMKPG